MQITIADLHTAGLSFEVARQLRQGTLQVDLAFTDKVADRLGLSRHEIARKLDDAETRDWHFYRTAARHATEVWKRVAESATAAKLSQRQIGEILGIPQRTLNKLLAGKQTTPSLQHSQAAKLATVLGLQQGADVFILDLKDRKDPRPSR